MNPGQKSAVKNHLNYGTNPEKEIATKKELCKNIGTTVRAYNKFEKEEYVIEVVIAPEDDSNLTKTEREELECLKKSKTVI